MSCVLGRKEQRHKRRLAQSLRKHELQQLILSKQQEEQHTLDAKESKVNKKKSYQLKLWNKLPGYWSGKIDEHPAGQYFKVGTGDCTRRFLQHFYSGKTFSSAKDAKKAQDDYLFESYTVAAKNLGMKVEDFLIQLVKENEKKRKGIIKKKHCDVCFRKRNTYSVRLLA